MDGEARGRISLWCSRKVADALRNGILFGGLSVHAKSEEASDDDEVPWRPKGGAKDARRSMERGRECKGKGCGCGIRYYGCASPHLWS